MSENRPVYEWQEDDAMMREIVRLEMKVDALEREQDRLDGTVCAQVVFDIIVAVFLFVTTVLK